MTASGDSPRKNVVGGFRSARSTVAKHGDVTNVRDNRPFERTIVSASTPGDSMVGQRSDAEVANQSSNCETPRGKYVEANALERKKRRDLIAVSTLKQMHLRERR
jgi:hypothetical protein